MSGINNISDYDISIESNEGCDISSKVNISDYDIGDTGDPGYDVGGKISCYDISITVGSAVTVPGPQGPPGESATQEIVDQSVADAVDELDIYYVKQW